MYVHTLLHGLHIRTYTLHTSFCLTYQPCACLPSPSKESTKELLGEPEPLSRRRSRVIRRPPKGNPTPQHNDRQPDDENDTSHVHTKR